MSFKKEKLYIQDNLLGFDHEGIFITDPLTSECQRFEVNPLEYYRITPNEVNEMYKYNELGKKDYKKPAEGVAEIILSLENSMITMRHGENNQVLFAGKAYKGDWEKIVNFIRNREEVNDG